MAIATAFSNELTPLVGNTGGALQVLPPVTLVGGRKRSIIATITLASQAAGTLIGVARLPVGAVLTDISVITDTSLGSATIAFGDANTTALYAAAGTLTTVQTRTHVGLTATLGVQITSNLFDSATGLAVKSYEDLVLTTAAAALPAAGTLKVLIEYVID